MYFAPGILEFVLVFDFNGSIKGILKKVFLNQEEVFSSDFLGNIWNSSNVPVAEAAASVLSWIWLW